VSGSVRAGGLIHRNLEIVCNSHSAISCCCPASPYLSLITTVERSGSANTITIWWSRTPCCRGVFEAGARDPAVSICEFVSSWITGCGLHCQIPVRIGTYSNLYRPGSVTSSTLAPPLDIAPILYTEGHTACNGDTRRDSTCCSSPGYLGQTKSDCCRGE